MNLIQVRGLSVVKVWAGTLKIFAQERTFNFPDVSNLFFRRYRRCRDLPECFLIVQCEHPYFSLRVGCLPVCHEGEARSAYIDYFGG